MGLYSLAITSGVHGVRHCLESTAVKAILERIFARIKACGNQKLE